MIQKRKMKNFQIRALFEYFNNLVNKPGVRPGYSLFVYNNQTLLSDPYVKIMSALNAPPEADIIEYQNALKELKLKFADRDEQNNPKIAQNEFVITEMAAEFNKGLESLNKKYPKIQEKIAAHNNKAQAILGEESEVNIDCLTLSEYVPDAPPYVVGLTKV